MDDIYKGGEGGRLYHKNIDTWINHLNSKKQNDTQMHQHVILPKKVCFGKLKTCPGG
jgi:hypothetical protein